MCDNACPHKSRQYAIVRAGRHLPSPPCARAGAGARMCAGTHTPARARAPAPRTPGTPARASAGAGRGARVIARVPARRRRTAHIARAGLYPLHSKKERRGVIAAATHSWPEFRSMQTASEPSQLAARSSSSLRGGGVVAPPHCGECMNARACDGSAGTVCLP